MSTLAYGETVTRLRPVPVVDDWGNTIPGDWAHADRLDIDDCALSPLMEPEIRDGQREAVPHSWTLYVRGRQVDIEAYDRIETRYGDFEVDGEPARWRSPFSGREAMTVKLLRIEG